LRYASRSATGSTVHVLVLGVFVLPLRFFFTVKHHEFFTELLVLHAEIFSNLDETTEAVHVIGVLFIDFFVDTESFVEEVHAAVARGNHETPLDFFRLDLTSSFEVNDSLLEHVLLGMVHTKATDDINFGGVVPVTLLIVVDSLELIRLLLVEVSHLGKNFRVSGHLGDQDVVPLEGLASHTDQFINMGNLVNNLITIRNNSVELFEGL